MYPNLVYSNQLVIPFLFAHSRTGEETRKFPRKGRSRRRYKPVDPDDTALTLFAAICICIEQTFSQASAHGESFGSAFSKATNAYLASTMKDVVNSAIAALPVQDYAEKVEDHAYSYPVPKVVPKLFDNIKTHRLRKLAMFAYTRSYRISRRHWKQADIELCAAGVCIGFCLYFAFTFVCKTAHGCNWMYREYAIRSFFQERS